MNAILNKNEANINRATMYVSMFPCNDCAKLIIQSGIKRVVYLCDKYADTEPIKASKILFTLSGVDYHKYVPKRKTIEISFEPFIAN